MAEKTVAALACGILGCICFGAGDWLMIYGDTAHMGSISWLTSGVADIAPWRNALAMALAFPGILFYGIALFAIADFLKEERQRNTYRYLTAFSLTPWLCLHLFYIMILYGFCLDVRKRVCRRCRPRIGGAVCPPVLARDRQ